MIRKIQTLKKRLFGGYNWASRTRVMRIKHHHVFKRTRRYHRHGSIALAILIVFSFLATYSNIPPIDVYAESATLTGQTIDGDFGVNNFAEQGPSSDGSCAGGTHCDFVDEDGETDYLGTGTGMNGTTAEEEFTTTDPVISGTLLSVDEIRVIINAGINGTCQGGGGTNCDGLNVRIFIDGAYTGTQSVANLTTTAADNTFTFASIGATTANDLRIEIVRVAQGGGGASGSDDDLRLYDVRFEMDYTFIPAPPMITQEAYIWENDDSGIVDDGLHMPATVVEDTTVGTVGWLDINNITSESLASIAVLSQNEITYYIKATNYGFNIPSDATIEGIEAEVRKRDGSGGGESLDYRVRIVKGGTIQTQNKALSVPWDSNPQVDIYGGNNDLWGTTWTPSDINSTNFGLAFSAYSTIVGGGDPEITYMKLKVYYSEPSSTLSGSEFSSPIALDSVRQGERLNLRMHLKNTGEGAITADDELALFYDRNDGNWQRVSNEAAVSAAPSSQDCNGFIGSGGSTDFYCEYIIDGDFSSDFTTSDNAVSADGRPYLVSVSSGGTIQNQLIVMQYVGSGGNCDGFEDTGGSDAWSCEVVVASTDTGEDIMPDSVQIEFSPTGTPYIYAAIQDTGPFPPEMNAVLMAYVGSGGNCDGFLAGTGGSDAWNCEVLINGLAATAEFDNAVMKFERGQTEPSIYLQYNDSTTSTRDIVSVSYVGTGGSCASFDDTGGSASWDCTTILDGDTNALGTNYIRGELNKDLRTELIVNNSNDVIHMTYVGSGGNCDGFIAAGGSDAWQCVQVIEGVDAYDANRADFTIGPDGTQYISTVERNSNLNSNGNNLILATRIAAGSGGNCDGFIGVGGSDAWQCERLVDGSTYTGSQFSSNDFLRFHEIVMTPSGRPTIFTQDYNTSNADYDVIQLQYVGSGGNCDGFDDIGGSDAWNCTVVIGQNGGNYGSTNENSELTAWADSYGRVYFTGTEPGGLHYVAHTAPKSQINLAKSENVQLLTSSRSDMTSATDTTNRDDADCISGSTTWNDGVYFGAEIGTGLTLPVGSTTAQCTEVMWTIDTSQATPGATYRFVVATSDAQDLSRGVWRGPIQIDEYPTITIADDFEQSTRYSKGIVSAWTGCDSYAPGSTGSSEWGCLVVDDQTIDVANNTTSVAFDSNGKKYVAFKLYESGIPADGKVVVAEYVGSGGNCDTYAAGSTGSDAWQCTVVDDQTAEVGYGISLTISASGVPYMSYSGPSNSLVVAEYVGSGGNCDTYAAGSAGSDAWQCTVVDDQTDLLIVGSETGIAINEAGIPFITYHNGTDYSLVVAHYVGSGGNCDTYATGSSGSDAWQCTVVDDQTDRVSVSSNDIVFDENNMPYISYTRMDGALDYSLIVAKYVGSGGNCDTYATGSSGSDAWQCTVVDDQTGSIGINSSIAINSENIPYISYNDSDNGALVVAHYVGSGGNCDTYATGSSGSDAWQCTVVDDQTDVVGGDSTAIVFGPNNIPHIAYSRGASVISTDKVVVAHYVGSGGNCDTYATGSSGSDAWQCTVVDDQTDAVGESVDITIGPNGNPYISYKNITDDSLIMASLLLPKHYLGTERGGRDIHSGDYQYLLSSGRSPANETGVNCSGNSAYAGYCGLNSDNGDYDSLIARSADEMPLYGLATKNPNNTVLPKIQWIGNTNLAPSTASTAGDIVIEVYRFGTTNAWEEVARDNSSTNCSANNCVLSGIPSGTVSEYFETINGEYWIYYRVYQEIDGATTINFKVDGLKVITTAQELGGGGFFRDGVELPLNQHR